MYEQLNQMVRSFGWGGRYLVLALITVDHNANVFILGVTGGAEALRRPPCQWPEVSPHTLTTGSCFEAWVSLFLVLSSPLSRSFLSLLLLSSRSAPVLQGQSHWAPPPTWIPYLLFPQITCPPSLPANHYDRCLHLCQTSASTRCLNFQPLLPESSSAGPGLCWRGSEWTLALCCLSSPYTAAQGQSQRSAWHLFSCFTPASVPWRTPPLGCQLSFWITQSPALRLPHCYSICQQIWKT